MVWIALEMIFHILLSKPLATAFHTVKVSLLSDCSFAYETSFETCKSESVTGCNAVTWLPNFHNKCHAKTGQCRNPVPYDKSNVGLKGIISARLGR